MSGMEIAARISAGMIEGDLNRRPIRAQREPLRPLDNHDGFFRKRVLQAKRFEVVKVFHAVQIHVVDLAGIVKFVNQIECRAGDVLFLGGAQAADDSFAQRGFSGAEVAA